MTIPYVSLPKDSLNNPADKPSSKKSGSLPNVSVNNFKANEPSKSKVINVLHNKKEKTPIPVSYARIAMVDPGFQDSSLSERTIVFSSSKISKEETPSNEEKKSQALSSVTADSQDPLLSEYIVASPNEITLEKKDNSFLEDKKSQGIFKQIFCCIK